MEKVDIFGGNAAPFYAYTSRQQILRRLMYSPECKPIADKIHELNLEKDFLQDDIETAPSKPLVLNQIKQINDQIKILEGKLDQCVLKYPFQPGDGPPPNPCIGKFQAQIDAARKELRKQIQLATAPLQADLNAATGQQKQLILQQIKAIRKDITENSQAGINLKSILARYNRCIIDHGGFLELNAQFRGRATATTDNSFANGPFSMDILIPVQFSDWDRRFITIKNFPKLEINPGGLAGVVVSQIGIGSGTFNPELNRITFTIRLLFEIDIVNDSEIELYFESTSPLDDNGNITLLGTGQFTSGFLDDNYCFMELEGTITPHPLTPSN